MAWTVVLMAREVSEDGNLTGNVCNGGGARGAAVRRAITVTPGWCCAGFPMGERGGMTRMQDLSTLGPWASYRSRLRKYSFALNLSLDLLMFAQQAAPVPQREDGYRVCLHLRAEDLGQWRVVHAWWKSHVCGIGEWWLMPEGSQWACV